MKTAMACFSAAFACIAAVAMEVDGVAARVGTETILKSDVATEMRRLNAPPEDFVRVRNVMIDRKLILKAAEEAKMTMQDWVVESRIRDIIERAFGGDRNKLMEALSKQRVSYPEWHARMKEDMVVSAMRWNVIDKNVTASPAAMRREFNEHPERYASKAKVTVTVILLKPEDAAKRDEVSAAVRTNDLSEIAKKYSADSRAAEGGVWRDIVPEDVFKPEICEEIAKMPRGTLSHWIEIDGWSFLIRKDGEEPARTPTFAEAYDSIEANVKEAEAERAFNAWIERLRSETYIKVY